MVVYLDSVFLLNTAIDYFLCLLTARLAGIPLWRKRYIAAALLGGIYATIVFLPGASWLSGAALKILIGLLITRIAYGGEPKYFRLLLLFCLLSCVAAGAVLSLGLLLGRSNGTGLSDLTLTPAVLILSIFGIWLALRWSFQPSIQNGLRGNLLPARISIAGNTCSVTVLRDTGNHLRDPIHGQPVLVVAARTIAELLPTPLQRMIGQKPSAFSAELLDTAQPYTAMLKPRLLPYRALGNPMGTLFVIQSDWIEICGVRYQNAPVALAPSRLGNGYDALWGGD